MLTLVETSVGVSMQTARCLEGRRSVVGPVKYAFFVNDARMCELGSLSFPGFALKPDDPVCTVVPGRFLYCRPCLCTAYDRSRKHARHAARNISCHHLFWFWT